MDEGDGLFRQLIELAPDAVDKPFNRSALKALPG
jgi:hypothetical protein